MILLGLGIIYLGDYMNEIVRNFEQYGFEYRPAFSTPDVFVLIMAQGIFNNAVVIKKREDFDPTDIVRDLNESGYAVKVCFYRNEEESDLELYRGFFKVDSSKERFNKSYNAYVKKICDTYACDTSRYRYISAPFDRSDINDIDQFGDGSVIEKILLDLRSSGPKIILVEAAAGFGKTSTSYEVGRLLSEMKGDTLPFMAELSRDRKARIFKHILLGEIDRSFPSLSSDLVVKQIVKGRVVVILDGFDELLKSSEVSGNFEDAEAMLETIGELLRGDAKIILTTRRTSVLEGDDFHKWVSLHENDFEVVRYGILEPRIEDWLESDRVNRLEHVGVSVRNIANPVILNYLRLSTEQDFENVVGSPGGILKRYFNAMLERERERQDLRINPDEQSVILSNLAGDMVLNDYTRADRDYLISYFLKKESVVIDSVRSEYPSGERPNRDEVANKLLNHALLDRGFDGNKIGFINDFVLGNYVAENILSSEDDIWFGGEKFIDAAVTAYLPRSEQERHSLWGKLSYVSEALRSVERLGFESRLLHLVSGNYSGQTFSEMDFSAVEFSVESVFKGATFYGCMFRGCVFNASAFTGAGFINCTFYDSKVIGECFLSDFISCQVVSGDMSGFGTDEVVFEEQINGEDEEYDQIRRAILELFWPRGKEAITFAHIPILAMYKKGFMPRKVSDVIDDLKKEGVFIEAKRKNWVGIDMAKISYISEILGRQL